MLSFFMIIFLYVPVFSLEKRSVCEVETMYFARLTHYAHWEGLVLEHVTGHLAFSFLIILGRGPHRTRVPRQADA